MDKSKKVSPSVSPTNRAFSQVINFKPPLTHPARRNLPRPHWVETELARAALAVLCGFLPPAPELWLVVDSGGGQTMKIKGHCLRRILTDVIRRGETHEVCRIRLSSVFLPTRRCEVGGLFLTGVLADQYLVQIKRVSQWMRARDREGRGMVATGVRRETPSDSGVARRGRSQSAAQGLGSVGGGGGDWAVPERRPAEARARGPEVRL